MSDYFEIKLKINPEISEIVSDMCFEMLECEGVISAEETYKDLEMIATTEGVLKIFVTSLDNVEESIKEIHKTLLMRGLTTKEIGSFEFETKKIENEDWSKKWKENWTVTHISDRITVVPTWIDYGSKNNEIIIKLDPGCAFGTGTHQTTQLCMKALEKYMKIDDRVADIGMGSGILAICAKKLGALSVYGCDNDETVIDVAKENAKLNDVQVVFELNTADKLSEKYDFICANILHNILAEIMDDLKNLMKEKAKMVLSGILDEKKPVVIESIEIGRAHV